MIITITALTDRPRERRCRPLAATLTMRAPADVGWSLLEAARKASGRATQTAVAHLVETLRPRAFSLAYRLMQDSAQAEDIVQESLLRLWRSNAHDTGQATLSTYFHRIVTNEALRVLSRQHPEDPTEPADLERLAETQQLLHTDAAPSGQSLNDHNDPHVVQAAVSALPNRQRVAITLWAYEDSSITDIAQQLGISENAAHQLLHRARQSLKRQLEITS